VLINSASPPLAVKAALNAQSPPTSAKASLRGYVEKMVGFGTRHTLSDTVSPTRGIGAARRWVEAEFKAMSAACGECLQIVLPSDTVTGQRAPNSHAGRRRRRHSARYGLILNE
jgi:hypothetical protein